MTQGSAGPQRRPFPTKPLLWCGFLVVGFLTLVAPDFDEGPSYTFEQITAVRLAAKGDVLVLQSSKHDYEFKLPENHLEQAFAFYGNDFDAGPGCAIDEIAVQASGAIQAGMQVYFGGYDARQSDMKSIIPVDDRPKFAALGFRPTNFNVAGYDGPPLYMAWRQLLAGRQREPGALPEGRDLGYRCQSEHKQKHVLSAQDLQSNQRWNLILSPFTALRHGIRDAVLSIYFLAIGYGGPSG